MEIATYTITAISAIVLLGVGLALCWRKEPNKGAVIAALSFGFLVLLLLHMSKFKHVSGFGFEAETWDEKQVEAAKLIDQLSSTSEALNQQVALLASRLGLWGPGLTNPELTELLQQMKKELLAASLPKTRIDEITAPVRRRIAMNYWSKAYSNLQAIYWQQVLEMQKQGEEAKASALIEERDRLDATPPETPHTLEPLIALVKFSKVFKPGADLLQQLNDLDADLRFFFASGENDIRRKINLDEAYPYPGP